MRLSGSAPRIEFLNSYSPSRMTTETVSKITRPMDVRSFGAKVSDQIIVQHLKTQMVLLLSSVTAPAGLPPRCSKDEVPVESQHLAAGVWEFRLSRLTMIRSRRCG
jgi:hypothetical protein